MPSRDVRRGGRQLSFEPGNVSPGIRPITGRPSLLPPSCARTSVGRPCGCLAHKDHGQTYGVAVFHVRYMRRGRAPSVRRRELLSAQTPDERRSADPLDLLVQASCSSLGLVRFHDACNGSVRLSPVSPSPWPSPDAASRFERLSRFVLRFPAGPFPTASHGAIAPSARAGGLHRLNDGFFLQNNILRDFARRTSTKSVGTVLRIW